MNGFKFDVLIGICVAVRSQVVQPKNVAFFDVLDLCCRIRVIESGLFFNVFEQLLFLKARKTLEKYVFIHVIIKVFVYFRRKLLTSFFKQLQNTAESANFRAVRMSN